MVKIHDFTNKQGIEKHSINLSKMGEDEEVILTMKMDRVWVSPERKKGVNKEGKPYDFVPMGIAVIYKDKECWCNLSELQAKNLEKISFKMDDVLIAYKPDGKNYVDFRKEGVLEQTVITVNHSPMTEFEKLLITKCLEEGRNEDDIMFQMETFKSKGKDIREFTAERIKWLVQTLTNK